MRAEYYADEYRRYASYCRNHSGDRLYKVACGQDDAWNEILMREAGRYMDGLSIHYYTMPGSWQYKGSAAIFNDAEWFLTMKKALAIEGLLRSTSAIMDRYDPEKRVGMIVDEWGTWFDVEPGTNPGFLYQQNTMRDALVAALTLNLFNAHAERVHMANIAQTVNVLQAMVLTDGPRMVCTPTYHVFEMYRVHQDAMLLPSAVNCVDYELGRDAIPQISAAASSRDGRIHVTLCNLHHEAKAAVGLDVRGAAVGRAKARQLAGESMDALNTFDMPDAVKPVDLGEQKLNGSGLELELSPHSVTVVELE
jgi:alpha-N-arabinofuranosidase